MNPAFNCEVTENVLSAGNENRMPLSLPLFHFFLGFQGKTIKHE